jgi:hypothetical protein
MYEHREQVRASVLEGAAQAFDLYTAAAARARLDARERLGIAVWLAGGAERLWRRYLLYNLEFFFSDLLEFLGVKRFD